MKLYRELNHPAELRIQVSGDTVEHLFVNAADALADILSTNRYATVVATEHVQVRSIDQDAALVDFLNEILMRSHAQRAVYVPESVTMVSEEQGIIIDAVVHRYAIPAFDEDIKAVTHQDVSIAQSGAEWKTTLVFDI